MLWGKILSEPFLKCNGIMAGKALAHSTFNPSKSQIHETETMADLDPTLMNIMVVVVVDAGNHTPTT